MPFHSFNGFPVALFCADCVGRDLPFDVSTNPLKFPPSRHRTVRPECADMREVRRSLLHPMFFKSPRRTKCQTHAESHGQADSPVYNSKRLLLSPPCGNDNRGVPPLWRARTIGSLERTLRQHRVQHRRFSTTDMNLRWPRIRFVQIQMSHQKPLLLLATRNNRPSLVRPQSGAEDLR